MKFLVPPQGSRTSTWKDECIYDYSRRTASGARQNLVTSHPSSEVSCIFGHVHSFDLMKTVRLPERWCRAVIPALGDLRSEDNEFETSPTLWISLPRKRNEHPALGRQEDICEFRPAHSTQWDTKQEGLHRETSSQKLKKLKMKLKDFQEIIRE